MSYSAGTFTINSTGQPVVSGTVISSTVFNALTADLATGLSTCVLKDGTQTITANLPLSNFKVTGLGPATARTDAASLANAQDNTGVYVGTVGGTADVITLTPSPAITALTAGQQFYWIASGANTTNVTLQVSGLTVKALSKNGATALIANDILSGALVGATYDGTRFQLTLPGNASFLTTEAVTTSGLTMSTAKLLGRTTAATGAIEEITVGNNLTFSATNLAATVGTLGTPTASTSGVSIDFTGIPSTAKQITFSLVGVSSNGTSNYLFQLGKASAPETSGYLGGGTSLSASPGATDYTTGFGIRIADASAVMHGTLTLTLVDGSTNTWTAAGCFFYSGAATGYTVAGSKSLSGTLDRVRFTTVNGTDAFDAGKINVTYSS